MKERSDFASNSTSSSRFLTRSPMLTMPHSRPSATTGKWRMRRLVISAINSPTVSPGSQVATSRVMISSTLRDRRSVPSSASAISMSRSDRMPSTLLPSSLTTIAPMRSRRSMSTASAIVASGRIVATQLPLLRRIVSTFIGASQAGERRPGPPGPQPPLSGLEDRTKCRTPKGVGLTRRRDAARLDRLRLDPVIGVEADQILDFLAQGGEPSVADTGVIAGRDQLGECLLHRVQRGAEQDLRVDAAAVSHRLEIAERQDRPAVAVAAALHPDERHRSEAGCRLGLVAAAREHQAEIGTGLGGGVDARDRLV